MMTKTELKEILIEHKLLEVCDDEFYTHDGFLVELKSNPKAKAMIWLFEGTWRYALCSPFDGPQHKFPVAHEPRAESVIQTLLDDLSKHVEKHIAELEEWIQNARQRLELITSLKTMLNN
jgi:hypothetical protein